MSLARWDRGTEILDVWASIQMTNFAEQLARALRLPNNAVRLNQDVDVGGSYGTKRGMKHTVLVSYLARKTGFPVRLVEDRLSAELGVSRMPIRDAIQSLVADGLAAPTGRRGTRVADLSAEVAHELVEVRATLEGLNAALAARRRDADILARLQDVLARGNAAARSGSAAELAALNGEYHDLLALAGSNRVLGDIMRSLRLRTELVFKRNSIERAAADWHEHAQILAAIVEGDEALASLMATRHVHRAAEARLGKPDPRP